jgi:hypothetical protein
MDKMIMVRCEICGTFGADAFCVRCNRVICEDCFQGFEELCIDCAEVKAPFKTSGGISSSGLRMLGLFIFSVGLLLTAMAFVQSSAEGVIVIFPFVIGNLNGWSAVALTLASIALFIATTFLPWFLFYRRGWAREEGVMWDLNPSHEMTDYIITVDLPTGLRKTIYLEEEDEIIHLRSRVDPTFNRIYKLPYGFEVDDYSYEYQENYLLLRLKLVRSI